MMALREFVVITCAFLALIVVPPLKAHPEQLTLTHFVAPVFPPLARSSRIIGTAKVTATAKRDGTVSIDEVTGSHDLFLPYARDCVREWRFSPSKTDSHIGILIYYCYSREVRDINPKTKVTVDFEGGSITVYVITDPLPALMQ